MKTEVKKVIDQSLDLANYINHIKVCDHSDRDLKCLFNECYIYLKFLIFNVIKEQGEEIKNLKSELEAESKERGDE